MVLKSIQKGTVQNSCKNSLIQGSFIKHISNFKGDFPSHNIPSGNFPKIRLSLPLGGAGCNKGRALQVGKLPLEKYP